MIREYITCQSCDAVNWEGRKLCRNCKNLLCRYPCSTPMVVALADPCRVSSSLMVAHLRSDVIKVCGATVVVQNKEQGKLESADSVEVGSKEQLQHECELEQRGDQHRLFYHQKLV